MNAKSLSRLVRNVESWGDAFPPVCRCGCGEPVRFNANSGMTQYVNRAHQLWDKNYSEMAVLGPAAKDSIPIEEFRRAVRNLKERKGLTYAELAEQGGQQPGWLSTYMYDKRYKSIGREAATSFFRRLAGLPEGASQYQGRLSKDYEVRVQRAITGIGMDPAKPKMNTQGIGWIARDRKKFKK